MDWKWITEGYRLLLSDGQNRIFPDASTIFSAINGGTIDLPYDVVITRNPKEDLPDLHFASIGAVLKLKITFENGKINIICTVERRGVEIDILGAVSDIPDSIVINGTWVYLTESCDEIKKLLEDAGVKVLGDITLTEYIAVSRELLGYPGISVTDDAREFLINHPSDADGESLPENVHGVLYPYQQQGYHWLRFITGENCGCILGDEMGLGKTLQVITLIASRLKETETPALVIAPVSLLENWRREFEKFTSGIRVLVHHGPRRTGFYTKFLNYDVVIISYNSAVTDFSILNMVRWNLLVLDEAQNIKNPNASRTKSIKKINRSTAIAVTGTPFENHITDLWSLVDFIVPGCLGSQSEFSHMFSDDLEGAEKFEPILTPLMLRRKVDDVAQDLPERVDIPQALELTEYEADLYEEERCRIIEEYGIHAALPMLQKLRMYCTHPSLTEDSIPSDPCINSTKYQRLCELLEEICSLGEKVILFTSFNAMFDILSTDIPGRFSIPVFSINGSTPVSERQGIIDTFSDLSGTSLLVLNPRAAGTGLNITAASRVIHYNLEWNPALEDQASARAYRRGQKQRVFIYRLYYENTVEEIINERIEKKREMFGAAVVGTDGSEENTEDLMRALMISPKGAGNNGSAQKN